MVFFDSHGTAWVTCAAEDEGAEAFGPSGCAKMISAHTAVKLLSQKADLLQSHLKYGQWEGAGVICGILDEALQDWA